MMNYVRVKVTKPAIVFPRIEYKDGSVDFGCKIIPAITVKAKILRVKKMNRQEPQK